jgi:hypothetical protein
MGLALALVGWSDVIIGLYPYRVGNPDWEFGAVSAALNSMPLGALGLGVSVAAAIAQRRRLALITLGVVCALVTAFMVVSGGMYLLSVPVILKAVPTAMRGQVFLVIIKALLLLFTYTSLYVILCRFAWKAARVNQKTRG